MLNPIRLMSYAAVAATGLLLNSCTHDPIEPAPVSIRGINKTMDSTAPVVLAAPLAPPRSATASVPRAAIVDTSASHRAILSEQASGGAVVKGKRSASAQKVHRHRVPQMPGAVTVKANAHRAAKFSVSTTALTRSHQRSIPLDEPVTRSAGTNNGGLGPARSRRSSAAAIAPASASAIAGEANTNSQRIECPVSPGRQNRIRR